MGAFGNPARDAIIVGDEMHYTMMERGSKRLRDAISAMHMGKPCAARPDLMWLKPYEVGSNVRSADNQNEPVRSRRDPCVRCGVREDQHSEGGCANYRRARVA